jgi:hypothetical protein
MEKKPEQIHADGWLKDLPAQTQLEGFKPDEMIACSKCQRLSAPNRLRCFYCNGELPVTETKFIKPNLRQLESWEKGFNLIYLPDSSNFAGDKLSAVASFLRFEPEDLQGILSSRKPLPLARLESETEAQVVAQNLKEFGVETLVLSDEKLKIEMNPRRLRGMEFFDDKLVLILFSWDEIAEIARQELRLIVSGAIFVRKIESTERHQRKGENKILNTAEVSSDEFLIDIYSDDDSIGYRIETKGFDFSCLGSEKQLLAKENIKTLVEKLRAFAPDAKVNEDYRQIRAALNSVWELEQKKDSKGVQKKGFGKVTLESITIVDNLSQFTKYSRLQWHLL